MDDKQLEVIVQRMIDAGESEENIASVIREAKQTGTVPTTATPPAPAPAAPASTASSSTRRPTLGQQAREIATDASRGFVKGMGQTATNLGEMAANPLTDAIGNAVAEAYAKLRYGTVAPPATRENAFAAANAALAPKNDAEMVGKTAEQIAEFFVPGKVVSGTPALDVLTKGPGFAKLGPMAQGLAREALSNAASSYGVSMAHKDANPERVAAIGAATPAVLSPISMLGARALQNPLVQRLLPTAGAAAAGGMLGGVPGAGVGATMGVFAAERNILDKLVKALAASNAVQNATAWGAQNSTSALGKLFAGIADQAGEDR